MFSYFPEGNRGSDISFESFSKNDLHEMLKSIFSTG